MTWHGVRYLALEEEKKVKVNRIAYALGDW